MIVFAWLVAAILWLPAGVDFDTYRYAADGIYQNPDTGHYWYYPDYIAALFIPFDLLPRDIGFIIWGLLNAAAMLWAADQMDVSPWSVLLSFHALISLYNGQIICLQTAALIALWRVLRTERWYLAGFLLLLATAKPHWGIPITLVLLWRYRPAGREIIKLAAIPALVVLVSLYIYGPWPLATLERIAVRPPGHIPPYNLPWHWIGPGIGLLWLGLAFPMTFRSRLIMTITLTHIAIPYSQPYDLVILYLFAPSLGWLSWLHLPLLMIGAWQMIITLPLAVYSWLAWQAYRRLMVTCQAAGQPMNLWEVNGYE